MIVVIPENGINRICLGCDVCGEPVEDGRPAIVRWNWTKGATRYVAEVAHKGACAGPRGDREMWHEADVALWFALSNAGDPQQAAERAKLLAEL